MDPIRLESSSLSPADLTSELERRLKGSAIRLQLQQERGLETAVLVAIVGAAGTALGTLIGGLLKIAAQKSARQTVVHGRSGRRIEIPAETRVEDAKQLVELAKQLDVDKISF